MLELKFNFSCGHVEVIGDLAFEGLGNGAAVNDDDLTIHKAVPV